jgi:hypothetical protein
MSIVKESNFVCAYCGLAGYKRPSVLKNHINIFCNKLCKGKFEDKRVEVKCFECGVLFKKPLSYFNNTKNHFCTKLCCSKFQDKKIEVKCLICNVLFMKKLKNVKTKPRHCCSRKCSNILIKEKKDWGGNRSKLEIAIEEHFKVIFPFIMIEYNETKIGYELDISVPCLELAIEINGIFHYEPIFGEEELLRKQQIDREKVVKCGELGIKLFVINVSKDKDNKKIRAQRISEVEQIVRDRINELDYVFENEQMVMEM